MCQANADCGSGPAQIERYFCSKCKGMYAVIVGSCGKVIKKTQCNCQ